MTRTVVIPFRAVSAVVICGSLCAAVLAQGTAFTYQGRLKSSGAPAGGQFDFQFSLWDAATGGSQQGSTLVFDGVGADPAPLTVTGGLFTVQLDFGNQFPGAARYLQIAVRPHAVGSYTTLAPRQPLTPSPYAIGLELPFAGVANVAGTAFNVLNNNLTAVAGSSPNAAGVSGTNTNSSSVASAGVVGVSTANNGNGVAGFADTGSSAYGVYGESSAGYGVYGSSSTGTAVYGYSSGQFVPACGMYGLNSYFGNYGQLGTTAEGVYGWGNNNSIGVNGQTADGTGLNGVGYNGAWGTSNSLNGNGLRGECDNGTSAYGVWGLSSTGWAGTFSGNAQVTGNFYAGAKFFRIDHPLDPENAMLVHACVESDEMKNVYDGVATLDEAGEAWVDLPDWFDSLNKDFRYQLTCIGGFAPVYVAQEIDGNQFRIAGGTAGLKVSWQVTGVRHDAYANAHPMQVEVDKQDSERGQYLHPAAFGLPESRNVQFEKLQAAKAARGD
jgi:hypothetical protein